MIRLGVIGHGGRISSVIKNCLREVEPDIRIVGIVDPDETGARSRLDDCDKDDVIFYENLDMMVKKAKLDALAIGTRCNLHTPYAIEASKYDIPLYLEKPVAINMDQALALEDAFLDSQCQVVVSFPLRVSPLCALSKEYVEKGSIGAPEHICAVNYVPYGAVYWEHEYRNYEITQGLFLQKATHDLDYMSFLMDSPIIRVAAMSTVGHVFGGTKAAGLVCSECEESKTCLESPENRKRNTSGWHTDDHPCVFSQDCGSPATGTNEDSSSVLVKFASGAHGVYTQVFYTRRDANKRGAIISGYLGTIDFDWYRNDIKYVRHHAPFTDTVKAGEGMSHFGGDTELAYNFIDVIRGKSKSRTGIQTGLQSVYACLAAKKSVEQEQFVDVRQVGE